MQGHVIFRGVCSHGANGSSRGSLFPGPSELVVDLRLQTEYSTIGFGGPSDTRGGRELGLDGGDKAFGLGFTRTGGGADTTGGIGGGVTTGGTGAGGAATTWTGGVFFGGEPGFVVGGGGGGDFLAGGPECLALVGTLGFLRAALGFTGSRATFFTGFN